MPPVSQLRGRSAHRRLLFPGGAGGGDRSPGPPGSPGAPCPSPSRVLCQQRWRGLTLPSSGSFAEPGPPLSPAVSPCPCTPRGAAPGAPTPLSPSLKSAGGGGATVPLAITLARIGPAWVRPPKAGAGSARRGGGWHPESHRFPGVAAGGSGGSCGAELGCTAQGGGGWGAKGTANPCAWLGCGSCLCWTARSRDPPVRCGRVLPLRRLA